MKLGLLEKSIFTSAVKRLNTQLRTANSQGWDGLSSEIESFFLPYKTTDKGYLSQSTDYYDKYDIDRIIKYSKGEYYIPKHKEELKENFGELSNKELKKYSSLLPQYKNKFSEYISRYYNSLLDKYGDRLYDSGKLTYSDIFEMVEFIDQNNTTTNNRNITFRE